MALHFLLSFNNGSTELLFNGYVMVSNGANGYVMVSYGYTASFYPKLLLFGIIFFGGYWFAVNLDIKNNGSLNLYFLWCGWERFMDVFRRGLWMCLG